MQMMLFSIGNQSALNNQLHSQLHKTSLAIFSECDPAKQFQHSCFFTAMVYRIFYTMHRVTLRETSCAAKNSILGLMTVIQVVWVSISQI
jgi:hypothetical protein